MAELHIKRRFLGYVRTLKPLFGEVLAAFKSRVAFVIISSVLAAGLELGGLSLIYVMFKSEDGGLGDAPRLLLVPMLMLAGAAIMYFVSAYQTVKLANLYAGDSLFRLLNGLRRIDKWPANEVTRDFSTIQKLNRIQRNALMVNARVLRLLNSLWAPCLLFVGGYILVFKINSSLGIAVSIVLIVLLAAQAVVSLKSARSNMRWESVNPKVFFALHEELRSLLGKGESTSSEPKLKRIANSLLTVQKDRILAIASSQLVISIGLIGVLISLYISFVPRAGAMSQGDLSGLLISLTIIIRIFMSLKGAAARFTVINRFYPQLSRYFRLRRILEYGGGPAKASAGGGSTTILTDLPDNRLNRLRWRFVLFGGQEVDFDGTGKGLAVSILGPSGLDAIRDESVWIDFEKMKNDPPVLCPAGDAALMVQKFKGKEREKIQAADAYDDDEDMV